MLTVVKAYFHSAMDTPSLTHLLSPLTYPCPQVSRLLTPLPAWAVVAGPPHQRIYLISMGAMVMGATASQRQPLSTTTMNRLLLGICWMTKDLRGHRGTETVSHSSGAAQENSAPGGTAAPLRGPASLRLCTETEDNSLATSGHTQSTKFTLERLGFSYVQNRNVRLRETTSLSPGREVRLFQAPLPSPGA